MSFAVTFIWYDDTRAFITAYNDVMFERYEQRMKMLLFNFDFSIVLLIKNDFIKHEQLKW